MTDPWGQFRKETQALVDQALADVAPDAETVLETPPGGLADLALPCFPLAKVLRKAPAAIAENLADAITPKLPHGLVAACEAVSGYLNFHADRPSVARLTLAAVRADGDAFAKGPARGRRVILEHTSANPNGPLHVGRARNPILGDTMARILRHAGWEVEVQYYVDDMGKQVATLAWGIEHVDAKALAPPGRQKPDHDLVRYYQGASQRAEEDAAVATAIQDLVRRSEEAEPDALKQIEQAYGPVLEGMLQSMQRIGVTFDSFIKESRFVANGATAEVIEKLNAADVARADDDGGRFLDLKGHGIHGRSQRFVYQRRDGTSLYATRDVAYHLWKAMQADRLINVLGEDHRLQALQVRIALKLLGAAHLPEVVFYAFVALPDGKMSTRRGRVVYLDDLIDEAVERAYEEVTRRRGDAIEETARRRIAEAVGVGALRYNIVRVQAEKAISFQWEEALNFEGASAPFVQYAYARCASILRKAEPADIDAEPDAALLSHESELALLAVMARLPGVVDEAARDDKPHLVPGFSQDLANALNAFYRDCPVLVAEDAGLRQARLALVAAAQQVLGITLGLVGVPALDTM